MAFQPFELTGKAAVVTGGNGGAACAGRKLIRRQLGHYTSGPLYPAQTTL